ncbi:uncharacterized protein LOC131684832 [Topomyia yanbarensis]|uniref:uncharacterized protein LOC131684832 n=1 Tax=Topomyia yanbarensis TaxID=2498891 RepID=UPI00273C4E8B|nr:uncharacterized protein LOC131684832 [Topomyia yanbarensis]
MKIILIPNVDEPIKPEETLRLLKLNAAVSAKILAKLLKRLRRTGHRRTPEAKTEVIQEAEEEEEADRRSSSCDDGGIGFDSKISSRKSASNSDPTSFGDSGDSGPEFMREELMHQRKIVPIKASGVIIHYIPPTSALAVAAVQCTAQSNRTIFH